jgi:hypothetical protein
LDTAFNYNTRPGKPPAPPYASFVNTPPTVPQAVLVTYNRVPPNPNAFTPFPQSGVVKVFGNLNGTNISCNTSGSDNNSNITIGNDTLPDLKPFIIFSPSSSAKINETIRIHVSTENAAAAPVLVSTTTSTYLPASSSTPLSPQETVGPLFGQSISIGEDYTYTCDHAGLVLVRAVVDERSQVTESDEANNVEILPINCGRTLVCYDYI